MASATLTCTPAGASDNSYVTLAEADAFFENELRGETWEQWTTDQRNRALISATADLERQGGARTADSANRSLFRGEPYYSLASQQNLHFPRGTDLNSSGSPAVPEAVKQAVYEQAYYLLKKQDEPDLLDHEELQTRGVRIANVDGMYMQYGGGTVPKGLAAAAWEYLRPYVITSYYLRG